MNINAFSVCLCNWLSLNQFAIFDLQSFIISYSKMSGEPEGTKALPKQVDVNRLRCKQDAVCQKQGRCGPIRRYNKLIYQELTAIARISRKGAVFKKMLHGVNVGCFVGCNQHAARSASETI
jgi:hypothetical protein